MDFLKSILLGFFIIGLIQTGYSKSTANPTTEIEEDDEYNEQMQGDDDYIYDDEDKSAQDLSSSPTGGGQSGNSRGGDPTIIVSSNPPYFSVPKYETSVNEGEKAILECNVQNLGPQSTIMWYNDTQLLYHSKFRMSNDNRLSLDANHSLIIDNVQSYDKHEYRCTILPNNITMVAELDVKTKPTASIYSGDNHDRDVSGRSITYHQGETIVLTCRGNGNPTPKIKWFTDGKRIVSSFGIHVNEDTLVIDSAEYKHIRLYQCLADNDISVAHATITINVQCTPTVTAHRHIVNTIIAGEAELTCNYNSLTAEKVQWFKETRPINDDGKKYQIENIPKKTNHEHSQSILTIKNVQDSDLGEYKCDVTNAIGVGFVKIQLVLVPEPPKHITTDIDDSTVITHWHINTWEPLTEIMLNYQKNGSKDWLMERPVNRTREHSEHWKVQHKMTLEAGVWHLRVKAKNSKGWSQYSVQETILVHPTYDSFEPDEFDQEQDMTYKSSFGGSGNSGSSFSSYKQTISLLCLGTIFMTLLRRTNY